MTNSIDKNNDSDSSEEDLVIEVQRQNHKPQHGAAKKEFLVEDEDHDGGISIEEHMLLDDDSNFTSKPQN